jgi:hypothetical protein
MRAAVGTEAEMTGGRARWIGTRVLLAGAVAVAAVLAGGSVAQAQAPKAATEPCTEQIDNQDPGAAAWAAWVKARVARVHPRDFGFARDRVCELDVGFTVFPPRLSNEASFSLPIRGGTETLTATATRWDRLPDNYNTPCRDDLITEHVRCTVLPLPDGSRLVLDDFYDVQIFGDPSDPNTPVDKVAGRVAKRLFPDGRAVSLGLGYDFNPPFRHTWSHHVLSLAELGLILARPDATGFFPTL